MTRRRSIEIAILVCACEFAAEPAAAQPPVPVRVQVQAGEQAPDFDIGACRNVPEPIARLRDLRGAAVLLEFCATWCGPCRAQVPHLNELHRQYADDGLVVLGFLGETAAKVDAWIAQAEVAHPVAIAGDAGPGPGLTVAATRAYGVRAVPTAVLIDAAGKIAWIGHPGKLSREQIEPVLAGARSPFGKLTGALAPVQGLLDQRQRGKALRLLRVLLDSGKLEDAAATEAKAVSERLAQRARDLVARAGELAAAGQQFAAARILHVVQAEYRGSDAETPAREAIERLEAAGEASAAAVHAAARALEAERLAGVGEAKAAREIWTSLAESPCEAARQAAAKALAALEEGGTPR